MYKHIPTVCEKNAGLINLTPRGIIVFVPCT